MNLGKVELLVNNSRELDEVGGLFTGNSFRKCSALSLTLKNQLANSNRMNEAINIIKKSTSMLSNFRGNNLLTTAVVIFLEADMQGSFTEINGIYERLKK